MIFNYDLLTFQVLTVEHIRHPNGAFHVKARPFSALSFRLDGKGEFDIEGKRLVAKAGDMMFLPAGKSYKVEYSCSEFIVVHMPNCNYSEAEIIEIKERPVIEAKFMRLLEAWRSNHSVNQAKAYIYEILQILSEKSDISNRASSPELEECVQYMQEHFFESDMCIDRICRHAYVSRSSLQRYFAQRFDTSPKQYILNLRMEMAVRLLTENEMTIAEVANACGFQDAKYFSRIFRQTYGTSPSQLRLRTLI